MQGIGPGSVLGGRYTADRRTAQYADAELWTARDTTLERSVLLFTVPRSHPNVDAVLDAARRSAGVDNSRLSRILDVGTDADVAFVVEEALEGSHSLAALLAAGPLPAPEVRRMAGETALVLDLARHRGLHHQRLTPDLVLRTQDGDVKVRGLATMAALAGVDDVDDQEAARADARSVVAIAYAGFTGHWPLPGPSGGLPPAPRVASHVAAPSEIAVGVPADLDALCRLTFANDQGPTTPGDFARQIAPWSPIPVLLPTLDPPEASDVSTRSTKAPPRVDVARPKEEPNTLPEAAVDLDDELGAGAVTADATATFTDPAAVSAGGDTARLKTAAGPQDGTDRDGTDQNGAHPDGADQNGADPVNPGDRGLRTSTVGLPGRARRRPADAPAGGAAPSGAAARVVGPAGARGAAAGAAVAGAGAAVAGAAVAGASGGAATGAGRRGGVPVARRVPAGPAQRGGPGGADRPAQPGGPGQQTSTAASKQGPAKQDAAGPAGPSPLAAMTAATTAALGSAGASTASAAKALSARLADWSTTTRDRARDAVEDVRTRREQAATARAAARPAERTSPAPRTRDEADSSASLSSRTVDGLEPPVPLLPRSAAEPLTRDQSRMAIGIVVAFLVVALGLAMWGLSRIPSLPGLSSADGTGPAATSAATPGEEETGGDGAAEEPAAPAAGQPLTFTDVSDFDPLGDGAERPEQLSAILDGDDSTAWSSEGYRSPSFSNLKTGLGVVLDLGESSSVSQVALVLPSASTGTIYVTDDSAYADDGRELAGDLAEAGTFSGDGTVTVDLAEGTSGRYVIVWFTEISTGGEQWYRARLAGASATS